jgi:hypothetical protein
MNGQGTIRCLTTYMVNDYILWAMRRCTNVDSVGTPSKLRWVSGSAKRRAERKQEGGSRGKSKRTQLKSLDTGLTLYILQGMAMLIYGTYPIG